MLTGNTKAHTAHNHSSFVFISFCVLLSYLDSWSKSRLQPRWGPQKPILRLLPYYLFSRLFLFLTSQSPISNVNNDASMADVTAHRFVISPNTDDNSNTVTIYLAMSISHLPNSVLNAKIHIKNHYTNFITSQDATYNVQEHGIQRIWNSLKARHRKRKI